MAITHADLAPKPKTIQLGSKTGAFLMVLSILCGLFCFILCLLAEATRSEVTRVSTSIKGETEKYQSCVYSGSGKGPLMSGGCAFLVLAIRMAVQHTYMLIAISKSPPALLIWDDPRSFSASASNCVKSITWQAGFFFVSTWICFTVGEILLLIGLSAEWGHLTNWKKARTNCLVISQGVFISAGVFGLATVFLATGLYLTALRAQALVKEEEKVRREASAFHVSNNILSSEPENHICRENENENENDRSLRNNL